MGILSCHVISGPGVIHELLEKMKEKASEVEKTYTDRLKDISVRLASFNVKGILYLRRYKGERNGRIHHNGGRIWWK